METQTYTADGINIWVVNDLCFGNITKTFATKESISPWGGQRVIGNISNSNFRPPYEVHYPCVGVNATDGVTYPLRIIISTSGTIVVQNDSANYIGPDIITNFPNKPIKYRLYKYQTRHYWQGKNRQYRHCTLEWYFLHKGKYHIARIQNEHLILFLRRLEGVVLNYTDRIDQL